MKKIETHKSNIEIFTEAKATGVNKIEMKTTRERSKDAIESAKKAGYKVTKKSTNFITGIITITFEA